MEEGGTVVLYRKWGAEVSHSGGEGTGVPYRRGEGYRGTIPEGGLP